MINCVIKAGQMGMKVKLLVLIARFPIIEWAVLISGLTFAEYIF